MYNNIMFPRTINVVFTMIDFVIQKCLAAQFIVRLSSIQV